MRWKFFEVHQLFLCIKDYVLETKISIEVFDLSWFGVIFFSFFVALTSAQVLDLFCLFPPLFWILDRHQTDSLGEANSVSFDLNLHVKCQKYWFESGIKIGFKKWSGKIDFYTFCIPFSNINTFAAGGRSVGWRGGGRRGSRGACPWRRQTHLASSSRVARRSETMAEWRQWHHRSR